MLEILFEDNHILAIWKPAGLLTQPSPLENESLENQAKEWLKEKYQKPGAVFLNAVHRLDRPVSGIVLFAKTSKALSRLNQAMREKKYEKIYLAEVEGHLYPKTGVLENKLIHGDFEAYESPEGKLSRLHYRVVASTHDSDQVEINLETGRYHQIRIQLSLAGTPIIGDTKYGAHRIPSKDIKLSHVQLSFNHPVTLENIVIKK